MPKKFVEVRNQPTIDSFFKNQKSESQNQIKMSQKRQSPIVQNVAKKIKVEKLENLEEDIEIISVSTTLTQEFDSKLQNGFNDKLNDVSITGADSTTGTGYEETNQLSTPAKSGPSPSTPRSSFTPERKVPVTKLSPEKSCRKLLQQSVDEEKLYQAIENINSVKERSTEGYEFELEKIYSANSFVYKYAELDTTQTIRYEIGDVVVPRETYADHLFNIIAEVLSNKINCEYFSKKELDVIYSYLCLQAGAQILFTKMIKRKRGLQRVKTMLQLDNNLKPFFSDLLEHNFVSSDLSNYSTEMLLNLLKTREIKQLCQLMMRTTKTVNKKESIDILMKLDKNRKSQFGGMSPATKLRHNVVQLVETCVYIPDNILSIFDRIFTLFLPCEYPINKKVPDIFLMMLELEQKKYQFYSLPTERYPVFRNRDHLISFVESQITYAQAIQASEDKQWDVVIDLGKHAFEKFKDIVENTLVESSQAIIPRHVGRFYTGHTWGKIVWHSVAALKKSKDTVGVAATYIEYLLKQNDYVQTYRGKWYDELALIKSHHLKDNEAAVRLLVDALSSQELTDLYRTDLIEKLKSYTKKKKGDGFNLELKREVELLLKDLEDQVPFETLASITITGKKINRIESSQGKSKWEVTDSKENKVISSVEYVAANYYKERGFQDCLHCEGALPVSLFTLFFWEQLFRVSIPGVFMSSYQEAPLDLFSSKFYENRKYQIEEKIQYLAAKDHLYFVEYMTEQYIRYKKYKTVFADIYESDEQFRDMVYCLGFHAILTMCKKLLENFRVWKSGFPDLIVWNTENKSYKISEVKGPKDTLSTKQRLWMQHLQQNGICTELCLVKAE